MLIEPAEGVFLHFYIELMRYIVETAGELVARPGLRIDCANFVDRLLHAVQRKQPVAVALQHK